MARILISAAHKSSGKTTVSIGLARALARRGLAVQPFKKGPDYIDPMWLGQAAGRPCRNLDFHTQTAEEMLDCVSAAGACADFTLIEGNKGLHDGIDLDGGNSNAAVAKLCGAPVVLVIDCRGMTRGVAPLLLGFQAFDRDVTIGGVILNQVGGPRHEDKLRQVVEHYTDIPVLGAVQKDPRLAIVERHLGLVPSNEASAAAARIDAIADVVGASVDLDRLLAVGKAAKPLVPVQRPPAPPAADLRIGIARDAAFGFYYQGDLEAFAQAGAELVPVDMMADRALPAVDGLFIGGGFPETHMQALSANTAMRQAVAEAVEAGLPVYAECGGLMYLCRSIRWQGQEAPMCNVIAADAVMHDKPDGKGYVRLRETGRAPWSTHAEGDSFPAHEFHYSRIENLQGDFRFAWDVVRGYGVDGKRDGLIYKNLLAGYAHQRHTRANPWVDRFVDFVRSCRQTVKD